MSDDEFKALMTRIAAVMDANRTYPADETLYEALRVALRAEFDAFAKKVLS